MNYTFLRETSEPAKWIEGYWEIQVDQPTRHIALPDFQANLVFSRETRDCSSLEVQGIRSDILLLPAKTRLFGVRFQLGVDQTKVHYGYTRVQELASHPSVVEFANHFRAVVDFVAEPSSYSVDLKRALQSMDAASVSELSKIIGQTSRHVQRMIARELGTSPKRFLAVHRLKKALALCAEGTPLSSAAFRCGYSDQAHFTRDVARFTGMAPRALMGQFRASLFWDSGPDLNAKQPSRQ